MRLYFDRHKGSFLKPCPGTLPSCLCCNYYVLNLQTNCNLDCNYCILQSYINNSRVDIYTNTNDALSELRQLLKKGQRKFYRIGTGELTDSLSLDHKTGFSKILVPFFADTKNALLELKTKSDKIENLLALTPKGKTIVSWSLNPQYLINLYEKNTASLEKRLLSAKQCLKHGYRLGFHLDPIILYPNWEKDYRKLIRNIQVHIPKGTIIWISIAGFRYPYSLKNTIQERFPKTRLFTEEMTRGKDGKYRYLRPVRVKMYKKIIEWLQQYDPDIPVYFCMESPLVWKEVFGKLPSEINNLSGIFGPHRRPVRFTP